MTTVPHPITARFAEQLSTLSRQVAEEAEKLEGAAEVVQVVEEHASALLAMAMTVMFASGLSRRAMTRAINVAYDAASKADAAGRVEPS